MSRHEPELMEYSVVYTERALNHMSTAYKNVMVDISRGLKAVYGAEAVVIVPGGGTFAMEAVARQFATDRASLIIRNGWFSYRWSQILDVGEIASDASVCPARMLHSGPESPFEPMAIQEVVARIAAERPAVVFAPHVETSAGIVLPDEYLKAVSAAVHAAGGIFVLDCIASGATGVDMADCGVDVLISAPQKGWTGQAGAGLVMLSKRALEIMQPDRSTSFACDLNRWLGVMRTYEAGGHAYHATMPTDVLAVFRDAILEAERIGFDVLKARQAELGRRIRQVIHPRWASLAAPGFQAASVVVSYASTEAERSGAAFAAQGLQVAGGVPLRCGEPDSFKTFRVGLFGFDKLLDIEGTVARFQAAISRL